MQLSVCLCVCLSVCLSVCPSVHVSLVSLFLPLSDFQKLIRKNIMEHNRVH